MFKGTSDNKHYIDRTGSHSTKPSRRGIINLVPDWAREPEEYYRNLKEQFDFQTTVLAESSEKLTWIKERLKNTLPFEEYKRLSSELEIAKTKKLSAEKWLSDNRALIRAIGFHAWGSVFRFAAKDILDMKTFQKIDAVAAELLNRDIEEIKKSHGERNPEYRKVHNRKRELKSRRNAFRERRTRENNKDGIKL